MVRLGLHCVKAIARGVSVFRITSNRHGVWIGDTDTRPMARWACLGTGDSGVGETDARPMRGVVRDGEGAVWAWETNAVPMESLV